MSTNMVRYSLGKFHLARLSGQSEDREDRTASARATDISRVDAKVSKEE